MITIHEAILARRAAYEAGKDPMIVAALQDVVIALFEEYDRSREDSSVPGYNTP